METGETVLGAIRNGVEDMRLIDADALIDWIDVGHLRHPSELCYSEIDVVNMINHASTIDAVEVVRCRDCKYYESVTARCTVRGERAFLIRGENDFCSRAKPKGGDPE